jgi:hypothetical protein
MRLGCDPEVFLMDEKGLVPVFGLIGADKWNPKQIPDLPQGFTLQEDNVALEFGIPPASSADEFVKSIETVKFAFLKEHPQFTFSKLSCALFDKKVLASNPQANVFGCEPDFNGWTRKENPKPKGMHNLRAAGGHVHVETEADPLKVVQAMDFYLGIPSLFMDKNTERRKLYGKAGAHRPKPYGVEYRTLSNFWIFEEKYIRWVWRNTERALESVKEGEDFTSAAKEIQHIINTSDLYAAQPLVDNLNLEVV